MISYTIANDIYFSLHIFRSLQEKPTRSLSTTWSDGLFIKRHRIYHMKGTVKSSYLIYLGFTVVALQCTFSVIHHGLYRRNQSVHISISIYILCFLLFHLYCRKIQGKKKRSKWGKSEIDLEDEEKVREEGKTGD